MSESVDIEDIVLEAMKSNTPPISLDSEDKQKIFSLCWDHRNEVDRERFKKEITKIVDSIVTREQLKDE